MRLHTTLELSRDREGAVKKIPIWQSSLSEQSIVSKIILLAARWAVALTICIPSLYAQTSFGQITGRVIDSTGATVPGAVVRARSSNTNVASQTITSSNGIYNILSLIPGSYEVTVEKEGFDKTLVNDVIVSASQTTTVNAGLKTGKVSSVVEVSAQAVMLNTSSSDVATTVDRDLLQALPYSEQNALEAVMLVPGVRGDPNTPGQVNSENPGMYTGNVAPGAATNISGGMPGSTSIMVDGSNVTQASIGRTALSVSGNMAAEVTVITNGVPAKYGNTGGGVIIQATRSGTNEYHGLLSWRHTDPAFNAFPLGGSLPNQQHQNFFGVYAGGPVWIPKVYNGKNKTFFYASYEPARLFNTTSKPGRVPTPDELAGKFANAYSLINTTILSRQGLEAALAAPRTGALYYQSPVNADGFPVGPQYPKSNQYVPIPNNDVSALLAKNPFAQYVMSQQPTPQNPGPYLRFYRPDGLWRSDGYNVEMVNGVKNVDNRYSMRVDHLFSMSDRLFFRYAVAPLTSVRFSGYPLDSPLTSVPSDNSWAYNFSLTENHIFTPTLVNELKVMYSRNRQVRANSPAALDNDYGAEYGLTPAVNGAGFPRLLWQQYDLWPGANGTLGTQIDANYQVADDVTWTKGKHTIGFGIDIRRQQSNQYNTTGLNGGSYTFSPGQTSNNGGGNSIASYMLGLISDYTSTPVGVPGYYRWHYYGGYIQDDFKILPNLTLNIGMRYEFQTPRMEARGNQGSFIPDLTGTVNGLPAKGAFCFANNCGLGDTLWPRNYKGFEPRFGIAWAPTSRMTVRANYGMMRVPLTGYGIVPIPDFNVASFKVGGTTGGVAPNQPVNYITNPVGPLTSAYTDLQSRGPIFSLQGITIPYINQTDTVPYIQQWGLTLQFQVASKTLLQTGYSGTVGTHLISNVSPPLNFPDMDTLTGLIQSGANFQGTNISNPYGITQGGTVIKQNLLNSLNPYQNFFNQPLLEAFYRQGKSSYHALQLGLTQRLTAGLSMQVSYTWSKSLDNQGGAASVVGSSTIYGNSAMQNPFDLKPERAVSNFDVPARLSIGYSYQLPMGRGILSTHNRLIDSIIGGWSTSGIWNIQSGMPFVPLLGTQGYFVSTGGGTALPTGITLRPDVVPGEPCLNPGWTPENAFGTPYLNLDYFAMPGSLNNPSSGNAPRTMAGCRSPRLVSLNASLMKKIQLGKNEKRYLQIQVDALNAFNHPLYYYNPNSGRNAYGSFNTASLTDPSIPAFTFQPSFGRVWQPNSAGMSRVLLGSIKVFF